MTRKFPRPGLTVAAAILVLGSVNSWASPQNTNGGPRPFSGGPGRGRGPAGPDAPGGPIGILAPLRFAASQLGLSDAQKEQIKAIAGSHAEEWKGLADRERQARQALDTTVAAQQFDEVMIRQRSAELGAVLSDIAVARARVRAEAVQILTADQLAKLKEIESQNPQARGRRG